LNESSAETAYWDLANNWKILELKIEGKAGKIINDDLVTILFVNYFMHINYGILIFLRIFTDAYQLAIFKTCLRKIHIQLSHSTSSKLLGNDYKAVNLLGSPGIDFQHGGIDSWAH
jgi:hypothetical protein